MLSLSYTLFLSVAPAFPPAAVPEESAPLAAALATIDADHLSADVHFIAADELEGRDTPSAGLRVAARFLRSRLQRLSWQPGAEGESYFHTYSLDENRIDDVTSHVLIERDGTSVRLRAGQDYVFRSLLDLGDLDASGDVIYCGTGTEENFDELELDGRWALCTEGEEHPRVMRNRARSAGAVGLLMTHGELDEPFEERYASLWATLRRGKVRFPNKERSQREVYPLVLLTEDGMEQLLELSGLGAPNQPGANGLTIEPGAKLNVRLTEVRRRASSLTVENVCGFWPGSDPVLAKETIIISAHYDHVGVDDGEVYNGADDNGSGTCGLLALAEALVEYGPLRRSVLLIWVSGEEKGLWGSKAWVNSGGWLPQDARAIANINIDMIGRNAPDELLVTPTKQRAEHNGLVRRVERLAPLEGFTKLGSADQYYHRSDQAEFARLDIPVSFLFADVHEDYHGPGDTADKLDYDKVRRVVRLVLRVLDSMQSDELDL